MKGSQKKVTQTRDLDTDEQKKVDQTKQKREEEKRERLDEFKNLSERQSRQRDQAEEGIYIIILPRK